MTKAIVGVIGGSGVYDLPGLEDLREEAVETPFGAPSDALRFGRIGATDVVFLARHGRGHRLSPSGINYRANIYALKALGVKHVVSVSACGSLRLEMKPRDIVVPDQLFDFTKGKRAASFYEDGVVGHASIGEPFAHSLRRAVVDAVRASGGSVHDGGTLITIEGPRFSTKAESRAFRAWGCDIIGMTACPEAFLARVAEMDFAIMAHVTDSDVWHEEEGEVTVDMVLERMHHTLALAQQAIARIVDAAPALPHETAGSMRHAVMTARERIPHEAHERLALIAGQYLRP